MTEADEQIHAAIREGNSFYLDAGAGSGKTSSLVGALTLLRSDLKQTLIANRQQVCLHHLHKRRQRRDPRAY